MTVARNAIKLVVPGRVLLPGYIAALHQGWSPDNLRGHAVALEQLEWIEADADAFLSSLDDPKGLGKPIVLPDGTLARRLPSIVRWISDGEFCGSISFRWETGTADLPSHVPGHVGFAVVPWKRRRGIGKLALGLMLDEARKLALPHIDLTTTPDNEGSRRVIEGNGGVLMKTEKSQIHGGAEALSYRIDLK